MTSELLQKLKNLQRTRGDISPFASPLEYEKWTDEVMPLLAFNADLQKLFKFYTRIAKSNSRTNSPNLDQINETIGILNQAIISEESNDSSISKPKSLDPPPKLTAKWIWEHAGWQFYLTVCSILGFAFLAGVKYSEIMTKIQSENLSITNPKNTNNVNSTASPLPSQEITATKQASIKDGSKK